METKEKESVTLLNDLVIVNNDRTEGYETAAKETEDTELKKNFSSMANESRKFKTELLAKVVDLNGYPAEGTITSGKIYRVWMELKSALAKKDRKAILTSCEYGEDAALETYHDILESDELSADCRTIITKQESSLQKSHDKIKSMRDSA
jgi:uncharacterized protein (TIGR02284 family)